jgi:hypothetical protein
MKIIKFVRNSAGIGLVEVMMAVAVTGGLTLTIAKLMENASQSAKQVEAKSENTNLKGLVQDVLNNTTACKNTFGPVMTAANISALSASPTAMVTLPNIKDKLNVIRYSTASTNISPLTITSMELTNYNSLAFTGDIIINSTFKKSTNNIVMVKPIRIPINFSFISGSLSACSTMAVGGEWLLGGNAGTVDGADYVGTSDNAPLNFKVNAQKSGRIDTTGQTFFGYQAGGNFNPYSTSGTGFGYEALKGAYYYNGNSGNSAFGTGTLKSVVTASWNTAIGWNALVNSHSDYYNTSVGAASLAYLTSGSGNTALGYNAMGQTVSGNSNTAIGNAALFNSSGRYQVFNTAVGQQAGYGLTAGSNNLFLGFNAGVGAGAVNSKLYIETEGYTSPLIGGDFSSAGRYVLINRKLGVGVSAMTTGVTLESSGSGAYIRGIPSGGLGVAISANFGNIVSPPQFSAAAGYEILKLGGNLRIAGIYNGPPRSQQIVFGNAAVTEGILRWYEDTKYWEFRTPSNPSALVISDAGNVAFGGWPDSTRMSFFPASGVAYKSGGGAWTATSDGRLKKNIKNLDGALDKISKLRPVSYGWKNEHLHSVPNGDIGFIAQEVEKIFPLWVGETETKSDDRLFLPKGAKVKNITLPIGFDAYLVKAIQELNQQVIKNQEMFQIMHDGLEEQVKANTKAIVTLEEELRDLKLENKTLKDRLKRIERALNIQ